MPGGGMGAFGDGSKVAKGTGISTLTRETYRLNRKGEEVLVDFPRDFQRGDEVTFYPDKLMTVTTREGELLEFLSEENMQIHRKTVHRDNLDPYYGMVLIRDRDIITDRTIFPESENYNMAKQELKQAREMQ